MINTHFLALLLFNLVCFYLINSVQLSKIKRGVEETKKSENQFSFYIATPRLNTQNTNFVRFGDRKLKSAASLLKYDP